MKDTTEKLHKYGEGDLSRYLWKTCCDIHGWGGTPKAVEMYDRIGGEIIKEYENAFQKKTL